MSGAELLPCPFCGAGAKYLFTNLALSKWRHRITCVSTTCGMDGPCEATKADAIAAWNRRPRISDPQLNAAMQSTTAWRLGEICRKAADDPKCGDYIDRGLILLRLLNEAGFELSRPSLAERKQEGEGAAAGAAALPVAARLEAARIICGRLKGTIAAASVASCECSTKTPDPAYHDDACRYRRLEAALADLEGLMFTINAALKQAADVAGEEQNK